MQLVDKKGRNNCKGFTLIEASLSMALIAVLSLIIALLISNMVSSYRRGLTLNQINTTGIDVVDDMRTSVQKSYSGEVDDVWVVREGRARVGSIEESVPIAGAFCTGLYSYVWNSGYFFAGKVSSGNKIVFNGNDNVKLLKVKDKSRMICRELMADGYKYNIVYASTLDEEPVDLLKSNDLALYDLSVFSVLAKSGDSNDLFYSVSFILGTVQGGINITAAGNFCAAPNDYSEDQNFDYCSINKFNFAARATGEVK